MREVFRMAPISLKEAAYGVGATQWKRRLGCGPSVGRGPAVIGGIMLGLGRALGRDDGRNLRDWQCPSHQCFAVGSVDHDLRFNPPNEFAEGRGAICTPRRCFALGLLLFVLTFCGDCRSATAAIAARTRRGCGGHEYSATPAVSATSWRSAPSLVATAIGLGAAVRDLVDFAVARVRARCH